MCGDGPATPHAICACGNACFWCVWGVSMPSRAHHCHRRAAAHACAIGARMRAAGSACEPHHSELQSTTVPRQFLRLSEQPRAVERANACLFEPLAAHLALWEMGCFCSGHPAKSPFSSFWPLPTAPGPFHGQCVACRQVPVACTRVQRTAAPLWPIFWPVRPQKQVAT